MSFYVTVTPTIQNVEVEVNPQTLPFEVEVVVNGDLKEYVDQAEAFADQAEASAISADNSADSALASATSATASANSASSSASSASSSASTATTQAGIATTEANEASQSASNALASEQASAISEANALASEQASAQSEANALSSEQNALASEQASALSASNALASENSASASASTATTQAGIATTQAGIATTQAGNALTSANNAAASASAAAQVGTSTLLTGFSVGANTAIAGTDSILQAFNKTQGQINARVSGTGVAGQVSFWNGTSSQTGSADFTWNNTAKVLAFSSGGTLTNEIRISSINTNTFFGRNAGISNNTGNINTFIGVNAGFSNTSGSNNTLIGSSAGSLNLTAGSLVCIGVNAGLNLTSGDSNVFIGRESGRWIADGTTSLTTSSTSILIGRGSRVNANSESNQIAIGNNAIGLGTNTTVIGNSSTTFGRWWGNLLIGTSVNSGFALDVSGTTRLNGLQTFQGTTASDTAPLGTELTTTGSGTNWTGTDFATGYTHTVGSTASLTTSIPAVNGTYYQIAYTITGRTAGSITINYGGTSTASITATGATGPRATSTANLEIVPTTDFDGTVVLSVRSIGTSSATTTINDSGGNSRIQIRATSSTNNTIVGLNSGTRITTALSNSFYGQSAGNNTTTGNSNSFFGRESGFSNTIGISNSFYGSNSGFSNISGSANSFFGTSSGTNNTGNNNSFFGANSGNANTTASSNSFFGVNSGFNNTTGSNNTFIGLDAGRRISGGGNLTVSTNSVFVGVDTRANADSETNQTVIGYQAIGLGSNTTVIGNSSTTFGRWWGNLLLGTSTNSGFLLDVNGTARFSNDVTIADTRNIILSTTTGTRIGTATNQRLALWNATPNVQPTNAITAAAFVANTSGIVNDTATFGGYTIGQIVAALQRIGALA